MSHLCKLYLPKEVGLAVVVFWLKKLSTLSLCDFSVDALCDVEVFILSG